MTDKCEYFRELMRSALATPLTGQQAREVDEHVAACAACGLYREDLAADDRLLADFARRMAPAVREIERTVVGAIGQRQPAGSREHWGSRLWRVAAAAVIVCGVVAVVGWLLLPLGEPSVTLAQTLARMRQAPWIHVVQTMESAGGRRYEYWERAAGGVLVQKSPDGSITYADYDENVMHAYDPVANRIMISFTTDSYRIKPLWNPLAALSDAVERAKAGGTEVLRGTHDDDGVQVERMVVSSDLDGGRVSMTYVRDVERNLLVRQETTVLRDGHKQAYATSFDYPERGPEDIYALGVPRDAAILDIRPEGPALDLVNTVQQRFERGFGDHVAVVLESRVDPDGASEAGQIAVLWQKGEMKRCDVYRGFDSQRRADEVGSLYSLVQGGWNELTIAGVLEVADVNALTLRLLFDGQRTIRWQNVGGQLVEDEHEIDQFEMPYGPVPHSLTGLIWPNLHLRLQSGSSQFKHQVRLLPEDPNRPGLVGLQFVEYAAREDYWFDPDKDYMQIERVRNQEGQGVTSQTITVETAQTSGGRWYPQVIRTEASSFNDAGASPGSRRELRVRVDANPALGDGVFLADTVTTAEPSRADASTAQAESAADEETEPSPADAGLSGTVRDEQGRPVADATVLLYHKVSEYGFGNHVVEQRQTDGQGQYVLTAPIELVRREGHSPAQDSYVLIATHPDYAFAWQNITQNREPGGYNLTLTTPTSRTILVTDHDGHPLPGVRVWLYHAGDRTSANPLFRDYLGVPTDLGVLGAATDVNGVASVANLPDTGCSFHATLGGYARGLAFPSQNHIRLSPGANVSGWVLTESGEPVSGVVVRLKTGWMHDYFLAESDEEGQFAFLDLPAQGWDTSPWGHSEGGSGRYTMTVEHSRYAGPGRELRLLAGETIDDMVVEVSSTATLVRCLVLEEGTNRPVAGARLHGRNETGEINGYSDADGVFMVRVLPGPTMLQVYLPPESVYVGSSLHTSQDWQVTFEAQGAEVDVVVRSPRIEGHLVRVSGTVVGPDGAPAQDVVVYGGAGEFYTAKAGSLIWTVGVNSDGTFELSQVPASRDLRLYAETQDHGLAATKVVAIPADPNETGPVELILQPTEKAVVVLEDQDGNVVADRSICLRPVVDGEVLWATERIVSVGPSGVLEIEGIVPGLTYHLRDARFESVSGMLPEGWREWFEQKAVVLIPWTP